MKKFYLAFALGTITAAAPVEAQLFSREGWNGAILGGLAGGIIGHNSGRHTAEGVAIGAGSGLLLGSLFHDARREQVYSKPYGYYVTPTYTVSAAPAQAPALAEVPPAPLPPAPQPPVVVSPMSSANSLFGR